MDELSKDLCLLGRLMDTAALRTRVIAQNMANVNTPGYTRSRVVFEDALAAALKKGQLEKAQTLRPVTETQPGGEVKPDGNNVHMEEELSEMVKTTILYNIVNRIVSGKISGLTAAITGR